MPDPAPYWEDVASDALLQVLEKTAPIAAEHDFYLAGGTALAAQLGHRRSVDLDFFRTTAFTPESLFDALPRLEAAQPARNTLNGVIDGVRVQFIGHPYPLLKKPLVSRHGVPLADPVDIGLMKLNAVMSRGAKKDFIDLQYLNERSESSLTRLIELMPDKYPPLGDPGTLLHLFKSLTWFSDAEEEPDPDILDPAWSWKETRRFFLSFVAEYARKRIET